MNIDTYKKTFYDIDIKQPDYVAEVLVEVVSVIRELIIGIKTEADKIGEENINNEKIFIIIKSQNDKYLLLIDFVKDLFPEIDYLNKDAFFDMMNSIGGTWKTMVDMYNVYNSVEENICEKDIN